MKTLISAVTVWLILASAFLYAEETPGVIPRAQDAPQPLSPEESAKRMQLPPGFKIELVASEPLIREPSCIAFDTKGRLFVCELHGYNVEGEIDVAELNKTGKLDKEVRRIRWEFQDGEIAEQAAERQFGVLKMLRDTDGDGRMDESVVWADDLPPCYGVLGITSRETHYPRKNPARNGVIVTCAPDIYYFGDTDGDGKPDVREKLFTGFEVKTLERGINNPRWGLDGWVYVGSGGDGGTITGPHLEQPVKIGGNDFRFKPDGTAIEMVNGSVGTFGMTLNDVGDRFPASGGRPANYALPLPYRYLARNPHVATPGTTLSAVDYNRGYRISEPHPWRVRRREDPAWIKFYGERETDSSYFSGGCSNEFYGDSLFPKEYHGNIFYCEPSLNIVHRCVVTRDGAAYRGKRAKGEEESEFLASTDQWFRPMNLRVGPEGALYIVDMYREIIEDYSAIPRFLQQQYGLDRGRDKGRIWRLLPENAEVELVSRLLPEPGVPGRVFVKAVPVADFTELSRRDLKGVLSTSGSRWRRETAQKVLSGRTVANRRFVVAGLQGVFNGGKVGDGRIRALYLASRLYQDSSIWWQPLRLSDDDFALRLHSLRIIADDPKRRLPYNATLKIDPHPCGRLQMAMTLGSEAPASFAIDALEALARNHGDERWMDAAILSSCRTIAGEMLTRLLANDPTNPKTQRLIRPLAATCAGERDVESASRLLRILKELPESIQKDFLAGLDDGFSGDIPQPADGWQGLSLLLEHESEPIRNLATKLSTKLKLTKNESVQKVFATASATAVNELSSVEDRCGAVQLLAGAPYETLLPVARQLLNARQSAEIQSAVVDAIGASLEADTAEVLLAGWSHYTPPVRAQAMKAIFARKSRLAALLDAIEDGSIAPSHFSSVQKHRLTSHFDPAIAERANKLLVDSGDDLKARIAPFLEIPEGFKPDLERGKLVFTKHCANCHKHGEVGFEVGPGFKSLRGSRRESILPDIFDPSAKVEPNYQTYLVETGDGQTFTGTLVSESPTSVTLKKEQGVTKTVLRKDIEQINALPISMMPDNFHELMNPEQLSDLMYYILSP